MKKIVIGFIICLLIGAFFVGNYYSNYKENQKAELINQGVQLTAQQITQTGNIPVIIEGTIQWVPLKQLCGGE